MLTMLACTAVLLWQCATPGSPSGGPRDTLPPQVIESESTPNPSLNFDEKEFYVTFDEWVRLDNPGSQVIVSPPLADRPEISLKGKTLRFEFDENELFADNTTYTVNFGESIQDITERNVLRNFQFVFSTGSYVDSLSLSGRAVDAITGEPLENVVIVLHENLADTALQTLLPSYFSSTSKNGTFSLGYLRSDTFRVYGLVDLNLNYIYDQPGEKIGFYEGEIFLRDSLTESIDIRIFEPLPPMQVMSRIDQGGFARIGLSRPPFDLEIAGDTAQLLEHIVEKDTLYVWHMAEDSLQLVLREEGEPFDTVALFSATEFDGYLPVRSTTRKIFPDSSVRFKAGFPVRDLDQSRIMVTAGDSTVDAGVVFARDIADPRVFDIDGRWSEATGYTLTLLPGAATDIFGRANDTVRHRFSTGERLDYSLLTIELTGLDSAVHYIFQILDEGRVLFERFILPGSNSTFTFRNVEARNYEGRVITDVNGNGIWDTGVLLSRTQPEKIHISEIKGLRPGWDLELTINLTEEEE